jgi:hypothetical protein
MAQLVRAPRINSLAPRSSQPAAEALLTSIVYRSRATTPLSGYSLYELVKTAQTRNRSSSITGLLLYDDENFYQWLEGPPASVARVMGLIAADPRHHHIEILSDKPATTRQFANWTMRLATRGVRSIHSRQDVIAPTDATFDALRGSPEQIPEILAGLTAVAKPAPAKSGNRPLEGAAGLMLRNVILSTVIPELAARHGIPAERRLWGIDSRSIALADLLIGPDDGAALELIRTLQSGDGSQRQLFETLLEPAARRLGDMWGADVCTEIEVTLGLGQLQRAVRAMHDDVEPAAATGVFLPAVLIVPEPGEQHSLTAILDSDALWQAGWDPQSEYPSSDEALLAGNWFDAMDLSLSASFTREHWLPRVSRTIALARHASRNPELVVVVGGRVFAEQSAARAQVGADGASMTAFDAEGAIRDGLLNRK